jgi:photosystem II stability/assembly factor-like uncharacterized protein
MPVDAAMLKALRWRMIGPPRGGRVVAVAGDPADAMTFYFGACAGGVWKTSDGGTYWQNVSDGFMGTAAVGAIAVAESDPNVVYAGMGEACIRGNVSHGDGVYRSTDAGKTWTHLGLADTRFIGRVRVHPKDPDIAYVAALGHAFGPNRERGVFRTRDGGRSWEQVLFRNEETGAVDLAMDAHNPRVLYASFWDVRRTPWSLTSGGPGSGLFKSSDGGTTWTELTDNPGLPKGLKGRIGVAVSPAAPNRVWALVEAEEGGLFRSDDGGATWERISEDRELRQRPWYYMHVFADPQDPETVYVLNLRMWKSTDGGRTFTQVTTPHGDNHDLWIDPRDPRRMIEGNDGGACVSFNGGATWSTIYNQPTAQFYHVAADTRFPYRVYGTQQDNSAISVPSRSGAGAIPWTECYQVGSSESGHIAVRPDNPNVVFSGAVGSAPGGGGVLLRYDHHTGQTAIVTVWPEVYGGWGPKDLKYRFQWTYPIVISPHDPNVLYTAGNLVFRSRDEGQSWEAISPDLTRNDPTKLEPSGGPITKDTTGAEHYCTVFAFVESPHEPGVFWAGSDDGLIHLSRDGGATWRNVTPPGLPEWATVSTIEVSPHDPATAYVAAYRYKLDDYRPYLYKTGDYGATWQAITNGIPENEFTRVIREDPVRRGLLFAGTETGLYVSFDDGANWQPLRLNLPVVPVYDLLVKDGDLVAATHGRSFWILDDLTPLREMSEEIARQEAHLFTMRPTIRTRPLPGAGRSPVPGKNYNLGLGAAAAYYETKKPDGTVERTFLDAGENPPNGVVVTYYLKDAPEGDVTLTFLDGQGNEIKTFSSREGGPGGGASDPRGLGNRTGSPSSEKAEPKPDEEREATSEGEEGAEGEEFEKDVAVLAGEEPRVPKDAGTNRFIWNMRYPDARKVPGDASTEQNLAGPVASPGAYQVRLTVNGRSYIQPFQIVKDPRVAATQEDFDAQFELLIQIRDKLSETHDAINRIRNVKTQLDGWIRRAEDQPNAREIAAAARRVKRQLAEIEDELIQTKAKGQLDSINFPTRLNAKLAALTSVVASADGPPTRQSYEVFQELSGKIDEQIRRLDGVIAADIAEFNQQVRTADLPAIVPSSKPVAG